MDNCVMSIAPTHIHFAVSMPKATGSDCHKRMIMRKYNCNCKTIRKTRFKATNDNSHPEHIKNQRKKDLQSQCSVAFNTFEIIYNCNSKLKEKRKHSDFS